MRNPFKRKTKRASTDMPCTLETSAALDAGSPAVSAAAPEEGGIEGRLVVMGRESTFSDEVVDYAIDMARRMSFEIVALNSAPLSCDSFSLFSTSRSKLCQEFQSIAEKNALAFRQASEAAGVPFVHVVRFDEPEQALAGLQREFEHIEFVIADAQPAAVTEQTAEARRPQSEVLVYSMI